ncbi:universal stress protein [Chloroflexota bacterium]
MYHKIMVPLDGSELAECVLPHVEAIATGCRVVDVVFVRALEPIWLPVGEGRGVFSDEDLRRMSSEQKASTENYLNQIVKRLNYEGANIQTQVLEGKAAESLAEYADKNGVDLVIISTHGRSGISRWVSGSVADRILRSACVPVLMVRAPGCVPGI